MAKETTHAILLVTSNRSLDTNGGTKPSPRLLVMYYLYMMPEFNVAEILQKLTARANKEYKTTDAQFVGWCDSYSINGPCPLKPEDI